MLNIKFETLNVSTETVRWAIKKRLHHKYKKIYYRSYDADDVNIKKIRYWLTCELFYTYYFQSHYMV